MGNLGYYRSSCDRLCCFVKESFNWYIQVAALMYVMVTGVKWNRYIIIVIKMLNSLIMFQSKTEASSLAVASYSLPCRHKLVVSPSGNSLAPPSVSKRSMLQIWLKAHEAYSLLSKQHFWKKAIPSSRNVALKCRKRKLPTFPITATTDGDNVLLVSSRSTILPTGNYLRVTAKQNNDWLRNQRGCEVTIYQTTNNPAQNSRLCLQN